MSTPVNTQYQVYENLLKFATKYRGYKLLDDKKYEFDDFQKQMQFHNFIKIKCVETQNTSSLSSSTSSSTIQPNEVYIFLITVPSGSIKKKDFDRFLTNVEKIENQTLIFVIDNIKDKTVDKNKKAILEKYKNLNVFIYTYALFICEFPITTQVALSYKILDQKEIKQVEYDLGITSTELPRRNVSKLPYDTPLIWYGAKPGDIVRIEDIIESSGISILYARVY